MPPVIRPYNDTDKEACIAAFKSNIPKYFAEHELPDFESFLDTFKTRRFYADTNRRTSYFVVEVNERVVGCGGFGDKDNTNTLTLAWGLIHKDFHKHGLGISLLEYRLQEIKKHYPGEPVYIDTTQHTYQFFEKYGFKVTKITRDFYFEGMHRYDMVFNGAQKTRI